MCVFLFRQGVLKPSAARLRPRRTLSIAAAIQSPLALSRPVIDRSAPSDRCEAFKIIMLLQGNRSGGIDLAALGDRVACEIEELEYVC